MSVSKVYYEDRIPLGILITEIARTQENPSQQVCELVVSYILYKGGFMEDGLLTAQFDAAFNAYVETNDLIASLVQQGLLE